MSFKKKLRVLVVDDSILFREVLSRGISEDMVIEVVGVASDPFEARDKIIELRPDILTLDVEMPKMNGIEFLKKLMPQYPLPVVVVSSSANNVFESLNAGAVDFVTKPNVSNPMDLKRFINELVIKIKIASTAKVGNLKKTLTTARFESIAGTQNKDVIIAIGASTGGTEAIYDVVKAFPRDMPGVVIVQHMPPVFTRMYAERLNNSCTMEVREAKDGDQIARGCALIAPGDYHMKVSKVNESYVVRCQNGEKVSGHCPSVDVLFDSVAEKVGNKAIGVLLTGMGADGAKGLLNMRKSGAYTIGQDEKSSIVYGMPMVAFNIGAVIKQSSLENIPYLIMEQIKKIK
jgi:two-component system chemotaxis response regulator CheB